MEKLQLSSSKMEEAEKEYKDKEEDVNAQARRVLLLEEEVNIFIRTNLFLLSTYVFQHPRKIQDIRILGRNFSRTFFL